MDVVGERELLLADGRSGQEEDRAPEADDDARERGRIVSRHVAALAEHEHHLAELEKWLKGCCG
ncbi:MAG TPA: hypothetical protein VKX39_12270 [Bryobacteraceae bacterium]|nr:hypothetical protein [Bryobacteraceae bacterium]